MSWSTPPNVSILYHAHIRFKIVKRSLSASRAQILFWCMFWHIDNNVDQYHEETEINFARLIIVRVFGIFLTTNRAWKLLSRGKIVAGFKMNVSYPDHQSQAYSFNATCTFFFVSQNVWWHQHFYINQSYCYLLLLIILVPILCVCVYVLLFELNCTSPLVYCCNDLLVNWL